MATIILISLFGLSFLGIIAMIGYRNWQLNTGRVVLPEDAEVPSIHVDLGGIFQAIGQMFKTLIHIIVVNILKGWVLISHTIEKNAARVAARAVSVFEEKNPEYKGDPSPFLRSVAEYKARMKRFRKSIKEKEQAKQNDLEI